jgi:hypothetical protein
MGEAYTTVTREMAEMYPDFEGREGETVTSEDVARAKANKGEKPASKAKVATGGNGNGAPAKTGNGKKAGGKKGK